MAKGGFFRSSNAPKLGATTISPATVQLFQNNVKDIKLPQIGAVELLSQIGILNKLLNQEGIISGKEWKSQEGISLTFKDARAAATLFGGLVPKGWRSNSTWVRGFLDDYVEYFGLIGVDFTDLRRQGNYDPKIMFADVISDEMKSLIKSMKLAISRTLVSGPILSKIINAVDVDAAAGKPGIAGYTVQAADEDKYGVNKKVIRIHVNHINQFTANQPVVLSKAAGRRLARVAPKNWRVSDEVPFEADAAHYVSTNAKQVAAGKSIIRKSFPTGGMLTLVGMNADGEDEDFASTDIGYTDIMLPSVANIGASSSAKAATTGYFYSLLDWLDPTSTKKLFGIDRDSYHFMKAQHMSAGDVGSGENDPDILDAIFDFLTLMGCLDVPIGMLEVIVDTVWLSHIVRLLEKEKGGYRDAGKISITKFNWNSVFVRSPRGGTIKITSYNEWIPNKIAVLNWSTWKFLTDGLFKVIKDPSSNQDWYPVRNDSKPGVAGSYEFLNDNATFGQLACKSPVANGIITDLPTPMIGRGGKAISPYGSLGVR